MRFPESEQLNRILLDDDIRPGLLNPSHGFFHEAMHITGIVANGRQGNDGCMPGIVVVDFGNRYVELPWQTGNQGL